jgi:UDP-N-acetylmuramate: L-alanyl-gamma-D-glutamyl-meso-diaminopimelate ligase
MKIHMSAICGMGMGSLAQLLKAGGHEVTGSDLHYYPPMSTLLERLGITIKSGFSAENIAEGTDLVIIGNAVRRDNPEVRETLRRKLRYCSFPQALEEIYLQDKISVVVAGTHGKTTTCTIIAWILEHAGRHPGFLIGGIARNFDASSRLGRGVEFVVEGDEYDTAYFDKGPKFLHYRPHLGVLTSIDFEHADIFRDIEDCKNTFVRFIDCIPPEGTLIACGDNVHVLELCRRSKGVPIELYGIGQSSQWRLVDYLPTSTGSTFKILCPDGNATGINSTLTGIHNALNTVAAFGAASSLGIPADTIREAICGYQGVKRRQEVRGVVNDIMIIDDFAHHPVEVSATISAVKERYAGRRLWAIWEPRTNSSRRDFFQDEYPDAFSNADRVIVAPVYHPEQIEPGRLFSPQRLVMELKKRGVDARYGESADDIVCMILAETRGGDAVLVMSNGAFCNIHERLLKGLGGLAPASSSGK